MIVCPACVSTLRFAFPFVYPRPRRVSHSRSMAPFKLKLIQAGAGGVPVLSVTGELDLYTAPEFEQRLREVLELEPGGLVVDLLGSTLLDSTACGALLAAAQRLRARQARLVIVNRDPEIARILDVMGLEEFLDVVPCGQDAQALGAAA